MVGGEEHFWCFSQQPLYTRWTCCWLNPMKRSSTSSSTITPANFTKSILYFQHYLEHHSASLTYAICSYLCNLKPHGQIFWEQWCSPCGGTSLPASRQFKYAKRKQPTLTDTQLAHTQLKFAPLPGFNADPILSPNHFLRITFSDKPRP